MLLMQLTECMRLRVVCICTCLVKKKIVIPVVLCCCAVTHACICLTDLLSVVGSTRKKRLPILWWKNRPPAFIQTGRTVIKTQPWIIFLFDTYFWLTICSLLTSKLRSLFTTKLRFLTLFHMLLKRLPQF